MFVSGPASLRQEERDGRTVYVASYMATGGAYARRPEMVELVFTPAQLSRFGRLAWGIQPDIWGRSYVVLWFPKRAGDARLVGYFSTQAAAQAAADELDSMPGRALDSAKGFVASASERARIVHAAGGTLTPPERVLGGQRSEVLSQISHPPQGKNQRTPAGRFDAWLAEQGRTREWSRVSRMFRSAETEELWGTTRMSAWVEDGMVWGWHVTDDPAKALAAIRDGARASDVPAEDWRWQQELGPGLYISAAPHFWVGRSGGKWDFLKTLTPAELSRLVGWLRDRVEQQRREKYISFGEHDWAMRHLGYVESGELGYEPLLQLAAQPYNIRFWRPDVLAELGISPGKRPVVLKIGAEGWFVQFAGLPDRDVLRAVVDAGFDGGIMESGMASNPEAVIWNLGSIRAATVDERVAEEILQVAGPRRKRQNAATPVPVQSASMPGQPVTGRAFIARVTGEDPVFLDAGGYGEVYRLSGGRVAKLTASEAEEACVRWLMKQPPETLSPHLPRVFAGGRVRSGAVRFTARGPQETGYEEPTFWYVREDLGWLPEVRAGAEHGSRSYTERTARLRKIVVQLWNQHQLAFADDIFSSDNWGQRPDGTWVVRDVACGTTEEGINPETQEGGKSPATEMPSWYGVGGSLRGYGVQTRQRQIREPELEALESVIQQALVAEPTEQSLWWQQEGGREELAPVASNFSKILQQMQRSELYRALDTWFLVVARLIPEHSERAWLLRDVLLGSRLLSDVSVPERYLLAPVATARYLALLRWFGQQARGEEWDDPQPVAADLTVLRSYPQLQRAFSILLRRFWLVGGRRAAPAALDRLTRAWVAALKQRLPYVRERGRSVTGRVVGVEPYPRIRARLDSPQRLVIREPEVEAIADAARLAEQPVAPGSRELWWSQEGGSAWGPFWRNFGRILQQMSRSELYRAAVAWLQVVQEMPSPHRRVTRLATPLLLEILEGKRVLSDLSVADRNVLGEYAGGNMDDLARLRAFGQLARGEEWNPQPYLPDITLLRSLPKTRAWLANILRRVARGGPWQPWPLTAEIGDDLVRSWIAVLQQRMPYVRRAGESVSGPDGQMLSRTAVAAGKRLARAVNALLLDPSFPELTRALGLPVGKIPLVGLAVERTGDFALKSMFVLPTITQSVVRETGLSPARVETLMRVAKLVDLIPVGPVGSAAVLLVTTVLTGGVAPAKALSRAVRRVLARKPRLHLVPMSPDDDGRDPFDRGSVRRYLALLDELGAGEPSAGFPERAVLRIVAQARNPEEALLEAAVERHYDVLTGAQARPVVEILAGGQREQQQRTAAGVID